MSAEYQFFFYGTLMNAAILARVLGRPSEHIHVVQASLPGYVRHHVKGEDYPALVRQYQSEEILDRSLNNEEATVRGSLAMGLTLKDVALLDAFEGDEYAKETVQVIQPSATNTVTADVTDSISVECQTYVWIASLAKVSPKLWSYDDFVRDKAHRWIGTASSNIEYEEVDRLRLEAHQSSLSTSTSIEKSAFGHAIRDKHFSFRKDYINLNHGSFGCCPNPVKEVYDQAQQTTEEEPDLFYRKTFFTVLERTRQRLANFVKADVNSVVIVPNATVGVNTVLRSLAWEKNDHIIYFPSSIYINCRRTLEFIIDHYRHLHLKLLPVEFTYPISDAGLLSLVEKTIERAESEGKRVRLALFDAISSNPGVVVPWEKLTTLCRRQSILSLVDGAHAIGQVPLNLSQADPDFFVSNCHKWLYAHRSSAIFYVSSRNHHLIDPLPIGDTYATTTERQNPERFARAFAWNGTMDMSSIMSIEAALDFRAAIGGEDDIHKYCHRLAVEGGKRMAEILGGEVMQNEEQSLIAHMVNIKIPLHSPASAAEELEQKSHIETELWAAKTFLPLFVHGGHWYIRVSAQIYNTIADFEYGAKTLATIIKSLNDRALKN